MKRVQAIVRPERLGIISSELEAAGFGGFTISDVRGHGQSPEKTGEWRGQSYEVHVTHKLLVEIYVEDNEVDPVVKAIARGAWTGNVGDGMIGVEPVDAVWRIQSLAQPSKAASPE